VPIKQVVPKVVAKAEAKERARTKQKGQGCAMNSETKAPASGEKNVVSLTILLVKEGLNNLTPRRTRRKEKSKRPPKSMLQPRRLKQQALKVARKVVAKEKEAVVVEKEAAAEAISKSRRPPRSRGRPCASSLRILKTEHAQKENASALTATTRDAST
jgi:hypothetical protein